MDTTPTARAANLEELSRLVKFAAQEIDRAVAEHLGGLSVSQWHVLAALDGGRGIPMAALGAVTLLPGPSLTRLIDGMVDENLVMRKADVTDRRRVLVYQTRRGASVYQRVRNRLAKSERLADVLAASASVAAQLPELLDHLRDPELSPVARDA